MAATGFTTTAHGGNVVFGMVLKLFLALIATKIVDRTFVLGLRRRLFQIYGHLAYGIDRHGLHLLLFHWCEKFNVQFSSTRTGRVALRKARLADVRDPDRLGPAVVQAVFT